MTFKIIHNFISDEGNLREIKWLDTMETCSEECWQWLPFGSNSVNLTCKFKKTNYREFEEGQLEFEHTGCKFIFHGKEFKLNRLK